jgi:hypothetical protein
MPEGSITDHIAVSLFEAAALLGVKPRLRQCLDGGKPVSDSAVGEAAD